MTTAFFLTSLLIAATPGTGVLFTISSALSRGSRASIVAAIGCTLGIVPHLVAAITGIAALMNTSAHAFQALKYFGVAYLLYMAWKTFTDKSELTTDSTTERSDLKVILSGVLMNVLNPKLTVFFFAFLPQFVDANAGNTSLQMIELSSVFMIMTLVVFVIYGLCAASARHYITSRPSVVTWMRRSFAGGFVALSAKLAVSANADSK